MAEFRPMVITNKGQALIAKMLSGGGNIEFTKIAVSSNTYSDAQILAMTSLGGVKQTTLISKVTKTGNAAVQIEGAITNAELASGYYMNTIALYAKDPSDGEIVYAACGASVPGWMPPYNGVSTSGAFLKLITTVSNADDVTIEVDPAAVATVGDIQNLQEQISDLQSFIGYTDEDIYGVEVDFKNKKFTRLAGAVSKTPGASFDGVQAFGGRKRCNVTDAGVVVAYHGDAGYSETGVLTQAITIGEGDAAVTYAAGTKVQVMVEQPKFYYKVVPLELEKIEGGKGFHMRKVRYYVSDTKKTGFKIHPAFVQNGVEKNFIYLSAYEGCFYDTDGAKYITDDAAVYASGDMLSSISGAKPASNQTRSTFRTAASARGAGWSQQTVQSVAATEILFLIEYASFNMQEKIGIGVSNKTDDGATNMSEITGATTNLGNASGSVKNTNGWNIPSYRGEENIYGNIWKWVDGLNRHVKDGVNTIHVADHGFTDNTDAAPYEDVGFTPAIGEGYVSAFGYNEDFDWLFICSEHVGNSSLPVGDYYWNTNQGVEWTVARLGGSWAYGSTCGGFYWYVACASGDRHRTFGGRLLYVPQ